MPVGTLASLTRGELSVEHLLELRQRYEVSSEAIFIRAAQVSEYPCAIFCASQAAKEQHYHLDYTIRSRSWRAQLSKGSSLPDSSVVAHCTAVGYTAKGDEAWVGTVPFHVECVAIPAYPGSSQPRVVGILTPKKVEAAEGAKITVVRGNALSPRGTGKKLIVQVVNDATPNWGGGGFAQALRSKWPTIQEDFKRWVDLDRTALALSNVRIADVDDEISVASMICQKGYGTAVKPRIRYAALRQSLATVATFAAEHHTSVHMPRIGCGLAGGRWDVIRELIASALCANGVPVTVYDLPGTPQTEAAQGDLKLSTA
jgi:O-acetyl-ADP-ribose deacetylase (regulator of RNase III)